VRGVQPVDPCRFAGLEAVMADPFNAAGVHSDAPDSPAGRMVRRLARGPESWGRFKTPSLRNVGETPPYMHNGTFETLREVLEFYSTREGAVIGGHHAEVLLEPLGLSERELGDLEALLRSLKDLRGEWSTKQDF
jgi:cytochrome c peroxidase